LPRNLDATDIKVIEMTKMPAALKMLAITVVAALASMAQSSAHSRVEVRAVESQLTVSGGLATAKFKIQVENQDESAMLAARIVFPGGIEVVIGDVAAGATAVTVPQKFVFAADDLPATQNVPVTVTLKYTSGDAATEMPALLIFKRAE
jgi:hypothetical protein